MKKLFVYISLLIIVVSFNGCFLHYEIGTKTIECGLFDFECHSQAKEGQKRYEEQEKLRKEEKRKQEILRKERGLKLCKKGQPRVDCIYETKMLDGRIRSEVYYDKNGKKEGIEKEWAIWTTEYGSQVYYLSTKNTYRNGEMIYKETFYINGNPISQENLKNGERYGWTKIYKIDGTPSDFMEYGKNGQILIIKSWLYKTEEATVVYSSKTGISTLTLPYNPNVESPRIEYKLKDVTLDVLNAKCLNGNKKTFKTQEELSKIQHLIEKVWKKTPLSSNDYYICE